jgi:hypothetical protein
MTEINKIFQQSNLMRMENLGDLDKIDNKEMGCDSVNLIQPTQGKVQRKDFFNKVMNLHRMWRIS